MRALKFAVAAVCAIALTPALPAQALTSRSITLSMSTSLVVSTNFAFSGKLTKSPKGSSVVLQRKIGSTWTKQGSTLKTTNSGGNFSGTAKAPSKRGTYSYRVTAAKTSKLAAATSSTKKPTVRLKVSVLSFAVNDNNPSPAASVTFTGTVKPWIKGTPVALKSRAGTTGTFATVVSVTPLSNGTFSKSLVPPASQVTQYQVVVSQKGNYAAAASSALAVDTSDPEITTAILPDGNDNAAYSATLTTKGNRPGSWSISANALPANLNLDATTGLISGNSNPVAGTYPFSVTFTDSHSRTDTANFVVRIDSGTLPAPSKVQVTTGQDDACRIKLDGTLQCWGHNWAGELGVGPTPGNQEEAPKTVGTGWASVSSGLYDHTCGIKTDYTAWCWGRGDSGQLGNGLMAWYNTPQPAASGMHFKQVSAGYHHSCGIRTDDTLWCWGASPAGGAVTQVGADTWKQVEAAQGFTCAIKSDDTLWCWGSNNRGWLGVGDTTERAAPTQVSGGGAWKQVSAGQGHTCGLKTNDTLYCWGKNSKGIIGDGNDETTVPGNPDGADSSVPKAVSVSGLIPDTWKSVSASGMGTADHTCAIGDDNTLWCWGGNNFGELGTGAPANNNPNPLPAKVGTDTDWASVSSGATHTCAVKTDDTLWCWGSNGNGQIGQGSFVANYPIPTKVN